MKIREVNALLRPINCSLESKTGQCKDHNRVEKVSPKTDQMPGHKTGHMKVHDTDPITDQTTGQRKDHRPDHIMVSGHIVRDVTG
jgi:hypothetical protein